MAKVQTIGSLREFVRVERRFETENDGFGNTLSDWMFVPGCQRLRAEIRELSLGAGESVLAAKLSGQAQCLVVLRASSLTRSITTDDRLIDLSNGDRVLNIRSVPPADHRNWIVLLCESGVAT
jgi:head-tail adaptor